MKMLSRGKGTSLWMSSWVNEMFGVGYYNDSFKNIKLGEGDTIEINNDLKIQFTPK